MHGQQGQLLFQSHSLRLRLAQRRVHRNNHISQHLAPAGQTRRGQGVGHLIALGKGEDIRRFIITAIAQIQFVNGSVISQQDAYFGAAQTFLA